jgi:hypothetical protein
VHFFERMAGTDGFNNLFYNQPEVDLGGDTKTFRGVGSGSKSIHLSILFHAIATKLIDLGMIEDMIEGVKQSFAAC